MKKKSVRQIQREHKKQIDYLKSDLSRAIKEKEEWRDKAIIFNNVCSDINTALVDGIAKNQQLSSAWVVSKFRACWQFV